MVDLAMSGPGPPARPAVRLAELAAALLVNVGCHADAHEQAKWFGDDQPGRLQAHPEPVQRRVAPAHLAHRRYCPGDAPRLVLVLVWLELDAMAAINASAQRMMAGS